jgi:DNA-binding response OmpR family regulator
MAERPTVMIVEDNEDTRELLRIALETEGFGVVAATDGVKLLPLIRSHKPSLILLDLMLPWVDGYELCRAIKDNPDLSEIPIFFVSAITTDEAMEEGFRSGASEYIRKPIDIAALVERIRQYLPSAA